MKLGSVRRGASAVLVGSVALAGVLAAPSPAQAVIVDGYIYAGGYAYNSAGTCTETYGGSSDSGDFIDNGGPVSKTSSRSITIRNDNAPNEVATVTTSSTVRATSTPLGGAGAARIDIGFAHAANLAGAATGPCKPYGYADGNLSIEFNLPAPMWLTMSGSGSGSGGAAMVELWNAAGSAGAVLGVAPRASGSATAYLPAGSYVLDANGSARVGTSNGTVVTASSFSGNVGIDLRPMGEAGAPAGRGARFVAFGGRNCATGAVDATLTRAVKKHAKSVRLLANGRRVANFAKPRKLKPRALGIGGFASNAPATATAVITLKNGKKVTVSRSYLACS